MDVTTIQLQVVNIREKLNKFTQNEEKNIMDELKLKNFCEEEIRKEIQSLKELGSSKEEMKRVFCLLFLDDSITEERFRELLMAIGLILRPDLSKKKLRRLVIKELKKGKGTIFMKIKPLDGLIRKIIDRYHKISYPKMKRNVQ